MCTTSESAVIYHGTEQHAECCQLVEIAPMPCKPGIHLLFLLPIQAPYFSYLFLPHIGFSVPRISGTFKLGFLVCKVPVIMNVDFSQDIWDIVYTGVVHEGHDQDLTFRNEGDNRNGPSAIFPSCSKSESECQMSPFDK